MLAGTIGNRSSAVPQCEMPLDGVGFLFEELIKLLHEEKPEEWAISSTESFRANELILGMGQAIIQQIMMQR